MGRVLMWMPSGSSASATALAMAAGAMTAAPSPTLFVPSGVKGERVCWRSPSIVGTSAAVSAERGPRFDGRVGPPRGECWVLSAQC